jgi:acetyltransferase-like isoleucine patch superfamily enzyme
MSTINRPRSETHSVIGAGAVVLEDSVIPPYSLVAGVPARIVRSIRSEVNPRKRSRK